MTAAKLILLWGLPADPPIAMVLEALLRGNSPVLLLDQQRAADTEVELRVGETVTGEIRIGEAAIPLRDIQSIYLRPHDSRELPATAAAGPDSAAWRHALAVDDVLLSWCDLTSALVLNRPSDMAVNNSKPYQALWIEALGFRIPDTLVTTDPDAAVDFWRRHDHVVYKSISGVRSIVSRLSAQHRERLADVAACPTQFQQYIAGREFRVHVVGEAVFACEVISQADDYRYAGDVAMRGWELPEEIAERCALLARSMQLPLAGLDLRCTSDGSWYCFEVNASPAFSYFEQATGQPIAAAIARLLTSGAPHHARPSTQTSPL